VIVNEERVEPGSFEAGQITTFGGEVLRAGIVYSSGRVGIVGRISGDTIEALSDEVQKQDATTER
jgi:hypothetical protein